MQSNNINNNINFGHTHIMHRTLTQKSVDVFEQLSAMAKNRIARYSQRTDFLKKELGFMNNAHFLFTSGKNKSYGVGANKRNNALARFNEHYDGIKKSQNVEEFFEHLGNMCHFLQDACTPVHTEKGSLVKKFRDLKKHVAYERGDVVGELAHKDEIIAKHKPCKIKFTNLVQLFLDSAKFSSQFKIDMVKQNEWLDIQQKTCDYSISATEALVKRILKETRKNNPSLYEQIIKY